jgi:transmembrane sensor
MALPETPQSRGAAYWFAVMNGGSVGSELSAAFRDWLQESPDHAVQYRACQRRWAEIGLIGESAPLLRLRSRILRRIGGVSRRSFLEKAAAATVLATACGTGAWWLAGASQAAYATGAGERLTVVLSDRSEVSLAPCSRICLDFSSKARTVTLERGQAFFTVALDAQRPFRVVTADREMTATGTKFQVTLGPQGTEVFLLQGNLLVSPRSSAAAVSRRDAAPRRLLPGQHLSGPPVLPVVRAGDPDVETAWLDGRLVFRDQPLSEVVADFNRYSAQKMEIGDAALAGVRISGTFRYAGAQDFMTTLQDVFGLQVEQVSGDAYRITRR